MVKRRYKQFCPVARSLDVIGERWTLLIVRDLLRGPRRYTDLRNGLPGMASNLLAQRLTEMEAAGLLVREHVVDPDPRDVYRLTERGIELKAVLMALGRFGLDYLDVPTDDEPLNPEQLPEGLATLLRAEELGDEAMRVRFLLDEGAFTMDIDAAGPVGRRLAPADRLRVATHTDGPDPSPPADVRIRSSMLAILLVRRGELDADDAASQGLLTVEGRPEAVAAVRRLFGFERFGGSGDT